MEGSRHRRPDTEALREQQPASRRLGADDDPERPWDETAKLAADWIWQRSEIEGESPLLVTNTFQNARGIDVLEEIARSGGQATPQGTEHFNRGPVLAYVPTERTLELALNLAHGYSLVVVETDSFPLSEWAAAAGATNLLDGSTSVSALDSDVVHALDRAFFRRPERPDGVA